MECGREAPAFPFLKRCCGGPERQHGYGSAPSRGRQSRRCRRRQGTFPGWGQMRISGVILSRFRVLHLAGNATSFHRCRFLRNGMATGRAVERNRDGQQVSGTQPARLGAVPSGAAPRTESTGLFGQYQFDERTFVPGNEPGEIDPGANHPAVLVPAVPDERMRPGVKNRAGQDPHPPARPVEQLD